MKTKLSDPWFCRLLIVLIACACLGIMTLVGCHVRGARAFTMPYVIYIDRPVELEDWESVEELKEYLAADDTDKVLRLTASPGGIVMFSGQCEDRAFNLRDNAASVGKRIETETINYIDWYRYYSEPWELSAGDGHMICKAFIGNEVWYIEPEEDRCWRAYYLD